MKPLEDRIREAAIHEVRRFFGNASERDWDGLVPPFIDWGRLRDCDGFTVAEYQGEIIGAIATSSQGMDGSTLPTIANVYVLRDFGRRGVGARLLAAALERLLAAGSPKAFCKVVTSAMERTIARLPADLKERLECAVNLRADRPHEETRGLD